MDLLSQNNVTPKAHVIRTVAPTTIWPGDYLEVDVPKSVLYRDVKLAVELHLSGSFGVPSILHNVENKIRIENTRCNPVSLRKHEHFCQLLPVHVPSTYPEPVTSHTGTKTLQEPMSSHLFNTHYKSQLIPMAFLPGKLFRL